MKVMVIGLDGASPNLVYRWMEEGKLPNLKRIFSSGVRGILKSTIPPVTAPAWTSFMTGVTPGKHGIYDFVLKKKGSYDYIPVNSTFRKYPAFWDIASRQGKKVFVANVPGTYPPNKVNGVLISGMLTPSLDSTFTYPPELSSKLRERGYKIVPEKVYEEGREGELLEELMGTLSARTEVILELMDEVEWDLFVYVIYETDTVSHWFWRYMDRDHPYFMEDKHKEFGDAILKIYKKADKYVGRIAEKADEDTVIFIISDHGMGPLHGSIYINNWLIEKGYLKLKSNLMTKIKVFMHRRGLNVEKIYGIASRLGLASRAKSMSEGSRKLFMKLLLGFSDVDWEKTIAFSMGSYGYIFLNVKGREPKGAVDPKDYEKVRDKLISELRELRNPTNGENAVDQIYKTEEIYGVSPLETNIPDLIYFTKDMKYAIARYYEFGSSRIFGKPYRMMSGDHRMEGIIMVAGDGIRNTYLEANIIDVSPTVLHLLGMSVYEFIDGRVLRNIFAEDHELHRSVKYVDTEKLKIKDKIKKLKKDGKI